MAVILIFCIFVSVVAGYLFIVLPAIDGTSLIKGDQLRDENQSDS